MAKIEHIKNKRGEIIYPVSKEDAIYDENGVLLSTKIATFITRLVDNLANYYLKSETYTKGEVDNLIGAIQGFTYIVVSELPTASAETMGIVYLVPSEDPQTQNVKDEYITIRSGVEGSYTYSWEQIGSTAIDLSGYVTTEALNTALADYTTTANLTTLLAAKQDTIADLSTIRSGAAAGATAYQKPGTGIPATDMASGVQTSLGKADSAYQKPSGGIPKTDLESGVQESLELADSAVQADPIGSIVPPVDPSEFATKEEVEGLEAKLYVKSKKNLLSFLNRVDASPTGAWPITKYDITEGVWYRGYSYSGYFYSAAPANQVQINTVTPTSLSFTQPIASYGLGLLVRVKGNTTYTLSLQTGGNPNSAARRIVEIDSSGNAIKNYGIGSFPSTFTTDANCVAIILCIYKASANESITISNWQLEEGSLATDFEPADVFITTDEQQCERESNKVSKISTGDSVKYPSTKAVVDYVHDETRETIDTTNYTGGTALDKTIFDVKNGNVVIVNTSASFPSGLKFTVVANGETVQTKNYYSAVSNDRLNITEDGTLKMSASSANTNNATIIVSLLNYGAIVERLVELVGNFAPDVASFELTNPAVKEFIDTVTYDNSDYTYTEVGDYNAKKQYRTDQPLPVTIRWIPEEVIDTYILVSENTPVVPVTWTSVQPPKSDFWYRVPSGVFSYDIYNLIPGKTYYYGVYGVVASGVKILKEGSFTTTGSVRMLNVDYAQNIRDLGGWAADGGMVKYDRIFRGDALDEPERLNHLSQAGVLEMSVRIVIREDIDLRGESSYRINGAGEIVAGSPIGEFAEYFPAGIQPYAAGIQNSGTTIASIFEKINSALTENRPRKIYFHCSGGCDRTGTLAFLILGLLGVSESDLSKEYELSTFANALGYPLGLYRTRNSTVYPFSGMVDAIKQYTGATLADKIETYLLGVGVAQTTIDSLRSELIETS